MKKNKVVPKIEKPKNKDYTMKKFQGSNAKVLYKTWNR